MLRSKWRCFAAFVLLWCAGLACAAKDVALPDELYSAKSVALIVRIVGESDRQANAIAGYKIKLQAKAEDEIRKQKHFELVSDPSKADLVCVLISYWGPYFREGKSIWNHTSSTLFMHPPQTLMVFLGGNHPQWSPEPLWMETATTSQGPGVMAGLLKDLQKQIKKPKPSANTQVDAAATPPVNQPDAEKPANADANADGASAAGAADEKPQAVAEEKEDPAAKTTDDAPKGPMLFCWSDFKNCKPAAPLYAAKTVFFHSMVALVHSTKNADFHKAENDKIRGLLQPGGRWSLVEDPVQADLIMVLNDQWANDAYPGGIAGALLSGSNLSILYLLKGGSKPDWDAVPLFTTIGGGGLFSKVRSSGRGTVLDNLQKFLSETQPTTASK
ncbi:MAG TPA: hypothetical protein VGJ51_16100 [Candidatus Angelobacter sp.]